MSAPASPYAETAARALPVDARDAIDDIRVEIIAISTLITFARELPADAQDGLALMTRRWAAALTEVRDLPSDDARPAPPPAPGAPAIPDPGPGPVAPEPLTVGARVRAAVRGVPSLTCTGTVTEIDRRTVTVAPDPIIYRDDEVTAE